MRPRDYHNGGYGRIQFFTHRLARMASMGTSIHILFFSDRGARLCLNRHCTLSNETLLANLIPGEFGIAAKKEHGITAERPCATADGRASPPSLEKTFA